MPDTSVIIFGFGLGFLAGILGAGFRSVFLVVSRNGHTDFWNLTNKND